MKTYLLALIFVTTALFAEDSNYQQKAEQAAQELVQQQIQGIRKLANSTSSANEKNIEGYVLSTYIRGFTDISPNIDNEIQQMREQIRSIIRLVATDIEIHGGNSGTLILQENGRITYTPNPKLPEELNNRREQLLKANLNNSVSVRSASIAIKLLAGINNTLMEQAKSAETRREKGQLYIAQSAYVYEMSDIVVELLEKLELEGKSTILNLHAQAENRTSNRIAEINNQVQRARQLHQEDMMSAEQLEKETESYLLIKQANEEGLKVWDDLIKTLEKQAEFIAKIKKVKSILIYKRDKAKLQLDTLRDLQQVAEFRDTIGSLSDLVESVSSLDLLVLDERTVRILLGYSEDL